MFLGVSPNPPLLDHRFHLGAAGQQERVVRACDTLWLCTGGIDERGCGLRVGWQAHLANPSPAEVRASPQTLPTGM